MSHVCTLTSRQVGLGVGDELTTENAVGWIPEGEEVELEIAAIQSGTPTTAIVKERECGIWGEDVDILLTPQYLRPKLHLQSIIKLLELLAGVYLMDGDKVVYVKQEVVETLFGVNMQFTLP